MAKKIRIIPELDESRLKQQLNAIGKKRERITVDLDAENISKAKQQMAHLNNTVSNSSTIFGKLKNTIGNTFSTGKLAMTGYLLALREINNAGREAKQTIKDIDKAVTDLQVATNMSRKSVEGLVKSYNEYGKSLASTTTDVTSAADDYLRAGKSLNEAQTLIKDSIMLSKLGQIESGTATEDLLAVMNGYEMSIDEVGKALDAMVALDMEAATSSGDIATALKYCASSADVAGLSFNKLSAMLATVQEKTMQSAETVGTFMNTLLSRYRNVKIGQFVNDDGEDLSEVETILGSLDVKLRDTNKEFRDFETVIEEVAAAWNGYSSVQQAAIAKAFSGTRQQNRFYALMEGYSRTLELTEVAANSAGTALDKFNNSYMNSLEAKENTLQASFESMILNSDMDSVYSGILETTTALVDFINQINLLKGALTGLTAAGAIKAFLSIRTGINEAYISLNQFQNALNIIKQTTIPTKDFDRLLLLTNSLSTSQMKLVLASQNLTAEQKKQIVINSTLSEKEKALLIQTYGLTTAETGLTTATTTMGNAFRALWNTLLANPLVLVTTLVSGAVMAWQAYQNYLENIRQSTQESANTYKESASSIDDYISRYQELRQALIEAKGNEQETYNIKKQLLDLQTELNDKFGEEYGKINLVTDAYRDQTEAIKAYNKETAQTFLNENRKGIKQAEKEMTKERHYNLSPVNISAFTKEGEALKEIAEQFKDQGVSLLDELGDGSYSQFSVHLNTDAQSAYDTINEFENAVREKAEELGNEHLFDDILDISSVSVNDAKSVLDDWGDIYQESLLANIAKDDALTTQMNEATRAVQDYNEAVLSSEDPFNDESVQKARENLNTLKAEMQNDDGSWNAKWQKYASIIEDAFNQADTRLLDFDNAIKNDTAIQELAGKLKGLDNLDIQGVVDSIDGANRLQGVAAQFANITSQSDEVKNAVAELIHYADEYGLETEELIDALTRLGYVQGEIASSTENVSNAFAGWDDLNEQIDSIQSSYKAIQAAQEEYNQYGYVSMDTLQALISLDSEYLACLIDENGQLQLNSATYQQLVQAKLAEAEATAISQAMTELQAIANGEAAASTVDYITGNAELMKSLALLTGQYSNVANAAMTAAQAQALSAAIESANGIDSTATEKVMANLNAKLALIQNTAQKTTSSFGGLNNAVNGFSNAQKGAGKATKDTNDALKEQKEALEAEKEALQEQKEAAAEVLEEQIDGIDDIIKGKEKEIDLLDDEIDKIKEAREERKRDIELQKEQYDLARAENQRPKLLYTEDKGIIYVPDTSGIRDKREKIAELQEDAEIAKLEKKKDLIQDEIDALEEQKDLIRDMIEESNKYYDNLIKQTEKSIKELSKNAEDASKAAGNAAGNVGGAINKLRDTLNTGKTLSYYIWTIQDEEVLANAKAGLENLNTLLEKNPENSHYAQLKDDVTNFVNELEKLKETRLVTDDFTNSLNTLKNSEDEYLKLFQDALTGVEERVNNTANYSEQILGFVSPIANKTGELKQILQTANEEVRNLGTNTSDVVNGISTSVNGTNENINRLTGTVADAVMKVNSDSELLDGSVTNLSNTVTRVTESTSTGLNNLAADMSNATSSISQNADTVNTALNTMSDSERFDNLTSSFNNLGEAILGVSMALGISEEGTVGGLVSAITAINEISLGGEEGGIIGQFHNLKVAIDEVSTAIAGGGGSKGSGSKGGGNSSGSSGTGGNKGSGSNSGTGASSVMDALDKLLQTTDETVGNGDDSGFSDDGETVIGKFGILKKAVNAVAEAIGYEEGAEGEENLISALMAEFNTANEVLPEEQTLFNNLESSIQACVGALRAMIDALNEINSIGMPGVGGGVSTGPAHAKGTVGNAFATGTGYRGLPEAEKNALRSENGQLELTLYPDGTTEITNKPIMSDLPKGTIIFNEDQTKQILNGKPYMRGKINEHGVAKFENNVVVRPSGEVLHPLPDSHPTRQMQQKFEAYMKKTNSMETVVTSIMSERNKEMDKVINQLNTGNIVTNNKNVQPSINVGDIHVTCPGVTSQEVMRHLGSALDEKFRGFHNYADQMSRIR